MKPDIRREDIRRGFAQYSVAFLRLFVVLGPVLLGLLSALYVSNPSAVFLASGVTLAIALLACDGWIIAYRDWISGGLALATQGAFLIFIHGYMASPFPAPAAISDALPLRIPAKLTAESDDDDRMERGGAWRLDSNVVGQHGG